MKRSAMKVANSPGSLARIRRAVWLIVAIAGLPATASATQEQTIRQLTRGGRSSDGDPTAVRIRWARPSAETAATRQAEPGRSGLEVRFGDTLSVRDPWVMRLELNLALDEPGLLAVAEAAFASSGEQSAALPPGADGARVVILRHPNEEGGTLVELLAGGLFLEDWDEGHFCLAASGAAACNLGTSFGITVDDDGRATLAVTDDAVEIRWWGPRGALVPRVGGEVDSVSLRSAKVAVTVNGVATDADTLVIVTAEEGSVWRWSKTEPPDDIDDGDAVATREIVKNVGRDIWSDPIYKKWWFWTPPVAVAACLIFDIWICGGDVSGNVILNPSR